MSEVAEMRKVLGSETPAETLQDKLNSDTESNVKTAAELQALRAETSAVLYGLEKLHNHLTEFGIFTLIPILAAAELARLGDCFRAVEALSSDPEPSIAEPNQ